jgi:hypothetical protein
MSICPEGMSCSDLGRVLVLDAHPVRKRLRQARLAEMRGASYRQGLPLVHFSAQPEPILSFLKGNTTHRTQRESAHVNPKRGRA